MSSLTGTISVIIITKNSEDLVSKLINSLVTDSELFGKVCEVYVLDNGSKDKTRQIVESFSPYVRYIKCGENLGFSKAVNLGYSFTKGEYILLLNSDVILPKGEVLKLKEVMDKIPSVGLCGPQLIYPDGSIQRSYSNFPSLFSEIVPRFIYEKIFLKRRLKKTECLSLGFPVYFVDALIGACLLIRRQTFEKLGGFDERFFFFLEETDFCLRVKKSGELVAFVPEAKIIHLQGMTVKRFWILGRIEYTISLAKFIEKYHGRLYFCLFLSIRFLKTFLTLLPYLFFPFLLIPKKKRQKFLSSLAILSWFVKGLPETYGLRRINM